MDAASQIEYRCNHCNKLLAKGTWDLVALQIKCNRCGKINSFFDGESDHVVITDADGVIVYANQALANETGYSLAEIIGKTPALWGAQMPPEFYENLWKKIKKDKQIAIVEVTNRRKDGQLYRAVLRISPILDEHGEPKFFLGIATKTTKV